MHETAAATPAATEPAPPQVAEPAAGVAKAPFQLTGGCHTLAAAGTSSAVGPRLDRLRPSKAPGARRDRERRPRDGADATRTCVGLRCESAAAVGEFRRRPLTLDRSRVSRKAAGRGELGDVARRPALALVPSRPVGAVSALPSLRSLAIAVAAGALLALLYLVARETSLFAIRSIEVSGAPPQVVAEVHAAAHNFRGKTLVGLDGETLLARIRALPSVVSARYDRAFPSTLRIVVRPERPVAVVRAGTKAWLVSARARIIRSLERGALPSLPRLWLPSATDLRPGEILTVEESAAAVRALARVPRQLPGTIAVARQSEGQITFVLGSGMELRLGDTGSLPLKLRVAAGILGPLSTGERSTLSYLDVSLPQRPVAGTQL